MSVPKKTVVGIYKVMYTVHCEKTLKIDAIEFINNESKKKILEFYIAFGIILICLTGDCFINKRKLRDPIKSYEIVPSIRLQWIFTHPSIHKFVRVSDARWE